MAIKTFMQDNNIHLRRSGRYSASNIDAAAEAAGRAAGDRATFGRPVTGAAAFSGSSKAADKHSKHSTGD